MGSQSSASPPAPAEEGSGGDGNPARRLRRSFHFADPDMDLFFLSALGWGSSGGLSVGQVYAIAEQIGDGDADGWVHAFAEAGDRLCDEADRWAARGRERSAGETRLQAFAAYRSAWQFAGPGELFAALMGKQRAAFSAALAALGIAATFFEAPYAGRALPGVFLPARSAAAPVVLVIGGADTSFEDLFLTLGRALLDRGFAVALADLPGQGLTQAEGLFWEARAERPIAAVIDTLVARFGARAGRIALIGLSLGGYFAARAAGSEARLATVIASTPLADAGDLFARSVAAMAGETVAAGSAAARSRATTRWKAGAADGAALVERTRSMVADPSRVTHPFLSILGDGDSPIFARQAAWWNDRIPAGRKRLVRLDAASGADGHCQVGNRMRLAQECAAWMDAVFEPAAATSPVLRDPAP